MEILYHDLITPGGYRADEMISCLQKSIRRGRTEDAVRAAYELFLTSEEMEAYMWKRLLVISAEDIGLGAPEATQVVLSLETASERMDRGSGDYSLFFVHAVRYLCNCRKERGSSLLACVVERRIRDGVPFEFPDYVYDMHTVEGQKRGRDYEHFRREAALVYPEAELTSAGYKELESWDEELAERWEREE